MKLQKAMIFLTVVLSLAVILAACSGGGGGGAAVSMQPQLSALIVAGNVSVVSAQTSSNVAPGKPSLMGHMKSLLFNSKTLADLSATSDYALDKTNVYVQERTSDAFKTINQILCMVGQTRYDAMLNSGAYTALVDKNLCDSGNSDPSSAGQQAQNQSSGANMPSYMRFTVESTRADDSSPEIVKVWVHQPASDHDQAALIFGKAVITEGTSTTNPYGIFTMNFRGYDLPVNLSNAPMFNGALEAVRSAQTGSVLLNFVSQDNHQDSYCGTESSMQAVTLDRLPDGTGGTGKVYTSHNCPDAPQNSGTEDFQFAYNPTDFYRAGVVTTPTTTTNTTGCLSRTSFDESAWSYGLYNANGSRVARNSGFSITGDISNTYFKASNRGWIGYWGLWTEGTATINNNDKVNKVDYQTNTSTPYTVFMAGGKLKKHDRKLLALNDIKGIPLSYWEQLESCGTGTQYQVVYDGYNFNKVAQMTCANNNCTWASYGPTAINLNNFWQGSLNFWSDSLGGQAQVQLSSSGASTCNPNPDNSCTTCTNNYTLPAGSTAGTVVFYAENVVNPGDTIPALACYDNCPLWSALSSTNPYYPWSSTATHNYSFNSDASQTNGMVLMDTTHPVVAAATDQNFQWGLQSGPLVDPNTPNLATLLDCNWDNDNNPSTNTAICGWKAWNAFQTFYTWETGPNTWNQFVTLKDLGGNIIQSFEAPLNVQYADNGTKYILQYSGFGQLNGIPGKCVDMDDPSNQNVDCSAGGNNIRWVPQFTIPALDPTLADGTLNTVIDLADNTGNTTYFVKPLNIEQRMKGDLSAGACDFGAATDFTGYSLPDILDPFVSNPTSPEPSAPAAPAVIGGVVQ